MKINNPLISMLNNNMASNSASSLTSISNPMAMLNQLAVNNPQLQEVVQALRNGSNPQSLFYSLCQQRGINPNAILDTLKGRIHK